MTPKEKAKELVDKYEFVYIQNYTSMHEVKQCALIAVDEIIIELDTEIYEGNAATAYWYEVREEIEKL